MLDSPKPAHGVIDWEFAREYSLWRCVVRSFFPVKIEEGSIVKWDGDETGQVQMVVYSPHSNTYYISVIRGNKTYHFTNPSDLVVVHRGSRVFR